MKSSTIALSPISSVRIIESALMVDGPFEDWSQVRSHGRAARRRRQGHRQNVRIFYKPKPFMFRMPDGSFVGHPETVARVRKILEEPGGKDAEAGRNPSERNHQHAPS